MLILRKMCIRDRATLVHEVDEHLQLVADLEVSDLRLVASVSENLEAHFNELVHAAHEHVLLAEQIGLGLLGEGGLDGTCAQGAQSLGVSQGDVPSVATRILLHGHDDRDATACLLYTSRCV